MNESGPTSNTNQTPVKIRSMRERIFVWGGILLLLLVVLAEWTSRNSYDATLNDIEQAIRASDGRGVELATAQRQVRGVAFPGEETSHGQRKVTYRWPSLFKLYKLGLSVNAADMVSLVESLTPTDDAPVVAQSPVVVVQLPLPKQGLPEGAEQVVALTTNDLPPLRPGETGSLTRELIRQGLLIAARDELGLSTLDATLGEADPETKSPQTFPFEVHITVESDQRDFRNMVVEIELTRPNRSGKWFRWSATTFIVTGPNWIESLVEQVEKLSRGEFVDALLKAGYQKSSGSRGGAVADPANLTEHLDFVSQYTLLRSLHAQIRANGESSEILGRLIRAYANLGHLTDFHWGPMHKVFKARSLLYAQRQLVGEGATPTTLAHRAYARALTGLHLTALDDIQAARAGEASGKTAPEWLNLIDAYCTFKPEVLDQTEGPQKELALYLRMRMADPSSDKQDVLLSIQDFLRLNPGCCRAAECLCEIKSLGVQRAVTESGFLQMWPDIYTRLAEIPNLPPAAKAIAEQQRRSAKGRRDREPQVEYAARVEFIHRLQQAAAASQDSGELSWTVLAELLRDVSFVQVWRVLNCEARWLGINADDSLEALKPLVEGHRLVQFIDNYSSDRPAAAAGLKSLDDSLNPWWLEPTAAPLATAIRSTFGSDKAEFGSGRYGRLLTILSQHIDSTYEDLIRLPEVLDPDENLTVRLQRVSPHWPATITWAFELNWENSQKNAAKWERTYSRNPAVRLSLARKYGLLHRPTDAERCFKKVIALAPSHAAHLELARLYRQHDDLKACERILEAALALPSYGLENTQVRVHLAGLFMRQGDWKAAKPHADAAAQSYAGWALLTAARCAEGLEDWDAAEQYQQAISERYENDSSDWYFWCVRVGRGDVDEARALAERHWNVPVTRLSETQLRERGIGQILAGDLQQAGKTLQEAFDEYKNSQAAFLAALVADELGESEVRDSLIEKIATKRDQSEELLELVNLLRNALRDGNQARWNTHEFDILTVSSGEETATFFYYVAGRFLAMHGQPELGRAYLESAATSYNVSNVSCLLANHTLRKQAVPIGKTRLNELPDSLAPLAKLLRKSALARAEGRLPEAAELLDQALLLRPDYIPGLLARGDLNEARENHTAALADYREALRIDPASFSAHNKLAWLLSACQQDDIRNGALALEHAQRAFDLRSVKTWTTYEALAAAHAECGDYVKAVEFQVRAQRHSVGNFQVRERLDLYRQDRPYRRLTKPTTQEQ